MKNLFAFAQALIVSLTLLIVLGLGLYGANIPDTVPVIGASLSGFRVEPMETGLSVYQYGRVSPFYGVSVLNDFSVDGFGNRSPHLLASEFESKQFTTNVDWPTYKKIINVVLSYFGNSVVNFSLDKEGMRVDYKVVYEKSGVRIAKKISLPAKSSIQKIGITVTYNSDEVVFDLGNGQVYSDTSPEKVEEISKLLGRNLIAPQEDFVGVAEISGVAIVSESVPGYLMIQKASASQKMMIDTRYQLIEVVEAYRGDGWSDGMKIEAARLEGLWN